jgi:hypothetical protein
MLKRLFALTAFLALGMMVLMPMTARGLVIPKDRPQLVQESVTIITGQVTNLRCFWNEGRERIYTEVTILVNEYLKGDEGSLIKFTVPGGTVDDITMTMSEAPNFKVGENVFLFLKQEDCRLAGWYQGKYIIEGDMAYPAGPGCTEKLSVDLAIPLEDLKQEIRVLVAGGPLSSY